VYGFAREPRIERIRSSSTVTVRLHVIGTIEGTDARVFGFHALFLHVVGGVEKSH